MDKLSQSEIDFIIESLNEYWYNAHTQLDNHNNKLGAIQKENLEYIKVRSKELMKKLGVFD